MVGVLARRLTGKYIAPESKHLTERVEEIHHGDYDQLIEQIMQKPDRRDAGTLQQQRDREIRREDHVYTGNDGIRKESGGHQSKHAI